MPYDNWRARLDVAQKYSTVAERRKAIAALKINFSQPGEADCGYYRKPITEKDPSGNGLNIIKGWIPVSYFMHGHKLVGIIGAGNDARDMTDQEIGDEQLWSYVVSHPISYETYQDVVEHGGEWPDMAEGRLNRAMGADEDPRNIAQRGDAAFLANTADDAMQVKLKTARGFGDDGIPAVNRNVAHDDNNPPEVLPHVEHAEAIDNAIGAAKDLKVTTVEEAAIAAGAANIIRDRRLAAEKVAKSKVTPLQLAYEEERGRWLPLVKRAKTAEDELRRLVTVFEVAERKRIAAAQLEAMEKQREQDEANARAADRAIASAQPEPPPVVEEVVIPRAPEPVKPTYGNYRPAAKPLRKFADIKNWAAVYEFFRAKPEVTELLQRLATNAVREGIEVPGAIVREGTE